MRTIDDVRAVAGFMAGFPGPWWVAGGWAIDLWLGEVSREHEDIEISVLRNHQAKLLSYCTGWPITTPREEVWVPLEAGELLVFPDFQLRVQPPPIVRAEHPGLPTEFEFMLNTVEDSAWLFRPEPSIRRAYERVRLPTTEGLWVTAPEVLLLHKARHHRAKDEHDFARARPHLNSEQRAWLRTSLTQILPADPWITQLTEPA